MGATANPFQHAVDQNVTRRATGSFNRIVFQPRGLVLEVLRGKSSYMSVETTESGDKNSSQEFTVSDIKRRMVGTSQNIYACGISETILAGLSNKMTFQ